MIPVGQGQTLRQNKSCGPRITTVEPFLVYLWVILSTSAMIPFLTFTDIDKEL